MRKPAFLSVNSPLAVRARASPLSRPLNTALVVLTVAVAVPSYTLSAAVRPLTVIGLGVT